MIAATERDRTKLRIRRPTPVPRDQIARHDPGATHTLRQPMWLEDTRRATRYELVAGSATGGILRPSTPGRPLPDIGQRITLLGGRTAPVRFVVQVHDWLLRLSNASDSYRSLVWRKL